MNVLRVLCVFAVQVFLVVVPNVAAQPPCGVVDRVVFPADPGAFAIVQDYGARAARNQGRYHTGEDWSAGAAGLGARVAAIARGRVTFASPNGWGRDGGVVIIEHALPDGSTAYSMIGHINDVGAPFPAPFTCVEAGDIIGAIAEVRPAPHFHLEIRAGNPDLPGAGYSWDVPSQAGLQRPSAFILNWQTWLNPAHRWHAMLNEPRNIDGDPITLGDGSLLILDGARVIRLSVDGRVLWRANLEAARRAVGLLSTPAGALLLYNDGAAGAISIEGELSSLGALGFTPSGAPFMPDSMLGRAPGWALIPTAGGGLIGFDLGTQAALWQLDGVPSVVRAQLSSAPSGVSGVMTQSNELITIVGGREVDRAQLREAAALASAPNDDLLVYGTGGAWRVDREGVWSPLLLDGAPGGQSAAIVETGAGDLYSYDGAILTAHAAALSGSGGEPTAVPPATPMPTIRWRIALRGARAFEGVPRALGGAAGARLTFDETYGVLLLTSDRGEIVVVRARDGALCGRAQVWGDAHSRLWRTLWADGLLRARAADQIVALDWRDLLGACG